jgi:hypothetical protein
MQVLRSSPAVSLKADDALGETTESFRFSRVGHTVDMQTFVWFHILLRVLLYEMIHLAAFYFPNYILTHVGAQEHRAAKENNALFVFDLGLIETSVSCVDIAMSAVETRARVWPLCVHARSNGPLIRLMNKSSL